MFDAMNEAANFGGLKAPDRLKMDIYMKAQGAKVPLKMEAIRIEKSATYITIYAQYEQTADIFGYKYVYRFDRKVEKPIF